MKLLAQPSTKEMRLLHQYFDQAVRQGPDRIALEIPPGAGRADRRLLTYVELDQQANTLARFLGQFVCGDAVVALLLPRRNEHLYVAQLATLKAGAAYTCIDPAFPDDQVNDILTDAAAVILFTDAEGLARTEHLNFPRERIFDIATLSTQSEPSASFPPAWLTPENLAYIIYTSGTTGRPKGVMIEHRSIANLVGSDLLEFQLSPNDRVAQGSSAAYDSSVEEIWLGWAAGATVVVMDDDTARLGPDLIPWLQRERITVLCPPPTLLRATGCDDPASALPHLSLLYVGGEALPRDVADRWGRGRRLENGYGPTECTVTATRGTIKAGDSITIGRVVTGMQAWVLNENLDEVPDGEQGELCLGGMGLARGYRNRPDLTAQKFPIHPQFGRIYRTGDLVHRAADGSFFYHGRIDAQVKLRGYRIELEAIEARLMECEGVREAACAVQENGAQQTLVAFVIPEDVNQTLSFDELKSSLRTRLPAYMIPGRFAFIDELPTTVGGKLNRKALPTVDLVSRNGHHKTVAPRNEMEQRLETAVRKVLRSPEGVSVEDDFFNELGGSSLQAAELISLLRTDPATAGFTVRDLYESRTIAELAKRAQTSASTPISLADEPLEESGHPVLATIVQAMWLLLGLILGSAGTWVVTFEALPWLVQNLGLIPFLVLSPVLLILGISLYTPLTILLVAGIKRLLIGRYQPLRAPVWGSFYVRNWMVQQAAYIIPWALLEGTTFQMTALRILGARIGQRVHIHRGVNLRQGGWDLLEIGDDVTISQDAALCLVDLEDGHIIVGTVSIGTGSTLDIRASVGPNTVMEPESYLTALSSLPEGGRLPRGERWAGIPASSAGQAPPQPELTVTGKTLSPFLHGMLLSLARLGVGVLVALPYELPILALAFYYGISTEAVMNWLYAPSLDARSLWVICFVVTAPVPLALIFEALLLRALGTVHIGVISRWSVAYIRVWLKTQMVQAASHWLSGTILWARWLRLAGMNIGRDCEISTIIDVVPELITIGGPSFFADGIYLGGPRVHRGTVMLSRTHLGKNTFLGNHAVIGAGQYLPEDVLLGVCTVADDTIVQPGTSWFGHPPFELPQREIVECDRSFTHEPTILRYWTRVFWELLRFSLPVIPTLTVIAWYEFAAQAQASVSTPVFLLVGLPLLNLAMAAFFCLLVLAMKWALLGRVRAGIHPLWSCWCSRWDFLFIAWAFYAHAPLMALEGTLLLPWYLRAMGMKIGRRVVLGRGFAQVVDPDMLHFEDGATVNCHFQAHTFEDRVLKIDYVKIGRRATVGHGACVLYGADIGARTQVAPHSVIMKREHLLPGRSYAGAPTKPQ